MRPMLPAALAAACCAVAPASAVPRQQVTATPNPVSFGQQLTIKGTGWTVFENCEREVQLKLKSAQNAFTIGTAHVRRSQRFTKRFTPRRSRVGAGRWRLVVRQRCESGKDGSIFFQRASVSLRIRS